MVNGNFHSSYNFLKLCVFLGLLILSTGCHSYMLDDAQDDLRNSFAQGNYEQSQSLLTKFENKNLYRSKDAVLWNLENGMVYRFSGQYDSSTAYLNRAEIEIENNYTKSISRGFASFLSNDNKLAYDGEPYENIYLNAFKALNFVHLKDWEGALVETRRMSFKMEQLDIRIKGIADAFSKADSTGKAEWSSGNVNIQNSAFSHYLSSILYAKTGRPDNARIEFEKLGIALREQAELGDYEPFDVKNLEQIKRPESYNVLITGFTGQSPIKFQEDIRLWDEVFYLKFSLPRVELYDTQVSGIRVLVNNDEDVNLHLIEEMDLVSKEVYQAKQPIIYSRALVRALVKAGGSKLVTNTIKKENESLGFIASLASLIFKEASEKADLRGWQTLPGQAWMNVIQLPVGTNQVTLEYLSRSGRVLYSENYEVDITPNTELELIESIYSK
jgi:hypothetical protein